MLAFPHTAISAAILLVGATSAFASSANFTLTAHGAKLVAADASADIPQFTATLEAGQTATFVAQGVVLPRGGKPQPAEPDAAAWLFDDSVFHLVPTDKEKLDKTRSAVTLKALKPGTSRVRFIGNILGYERKIDIAITVREAQP